MKTVQMTVQVTFDENKTDSESIASALDRLMETATSTPGVLDEYGKVSVGEFCPPPGSVWDDSISTSVTPTPSGRCPFEDEHEEEP